MNKIGKQFDRMTSRMDKLIGLDAIYTSRSYGDLDLITGEQTISELPCRVKVRPMPLSRRDLVELAQAGLTQVETRWSMRAAYVSDVKAQDMLSVSGFNYEILDTPSSELDEFGVEWTLYTRRIRG